MKVKIPVYVITTASKYVGDVEIEDIADFDEAADALWSSQGYEPTIRTNITNDFDLGDPEIEELSQENFDSYKLEQEKANVVNKKV